MFKGSNTALVTPFKNGAVDYDAVAALAERQIAAGTHGLVPCGTTGEGATLDFDEHMKVVECVIKVAKGRLPVIAGTGSNDTAQAVANHRRAAELGADAGLVVAPYYNKPSQDGIYAHIKAVHDSCDLPVVVYNVPGRTIVDISPATMGRLAELPRVVAIKDATADMSRVTALRRLTGPDFCQLSGDDMSAVGFNATGGVGIISVTSNVAPEACAALQEATLAGRWDEARTLQDRLLPLHNAMFASPSPGPAKYALSLMGLCSDETRLPITPPDEAARRVIRDAMAIAGLLEPA